MIHSQDPTSNAPPYIARRLAIQTCTVKFGQNSRSSIVRLQITIIFVHIGPTWQNVWEDWYDLRLRLAMILLLDRHEHTYRAKKKNVLVFASTFDFSNGSLVEDLR